MSRATVVYLSMIAALVGGLWSILAVGDRLVAPEDLSGRWMAVPPAAGGGWPAMTVEQSGQFFELAIENGPPRVAVAVVDRADDGRLSLARGPWRVTVDPPAADGVRTFRVDGPRPGTFTGRRATPATAPAVVAPASTRPAPKEAA